MWVGEGDGSPLQYSCLENPMDGGAWWAAVYGVLKSRTRLKRLSSSSSSSSRSSSSNIICYNMNEPWGPYVKGNKPVTKRQVPYDSTYMMHLKWSDSQRQKVEWWLLGAGWRGKYGAISQSQFCKMKSSGGGWWWWSCNSVNVFNTTIHTHTYTHTPGEGHGNPLQDSCLPGKSQDRGVWWVTVHGVAKT